MWVIGEPGPDVDLEVGQRVEHGSDTNAGLAVAVQVGAHRLAVAVEMAGDGRDRPAPFLQRVGFHVFSLCEHGERGSFDLVGIRTASVDGAPPQLVDLAVVHPAAQGWGISVIRSGELPVIGGNGDDESDGGRCVHLPRNHVARHQSAARKQQDLVFDHPVPGPRCGARGMGCCWRGRGRGRRCPTGRPGKRSLAHHLPAFEKVPSGATYAAREGDVVVWVSLRPAGLTAHQIHRSRPSPDFNAPKHSTTPPAPAEVTDERNQRAPSEPLGGSPPSPRTAVAAHSMVYTAPGALRAAWPSRPSTSSVPSSPPSSTTSPSTPRPVPDDASTPDACRRHLARLATRTPPPQVAGFVAHRPRFCAAGDECSVRRSLANCGVKHAPAHSSLGSIPWGRPRVHTSSNLALALRWRSKNAPIRSARSRAAVAS